ncbi:peptidoglycan-binding domain-containing protein [uncultured Thiothrix sp.]|uniref:peptidoglycan-binding domain-containing protein n=1 Tax=uncultured Thiothrix sp. TaxID=223185 RepID=UPI00261EB7F4|nr:peptidoglycan-binding domain-containing protein [uncultured Thiothrix sp.]HMT92923.1 peptidoglycan-binding domain-containing protein [Thiolinea sp.]
MPSLNRTDFLQEMTNKNLSTFHASQDPRLAGLNWSSLDLNRNGVLSSTEFTYLFTALDRFDVNGSSLSLDLGTTNAPTIVGKMVAAIRELVTTTSTPPTSTGNLADRALAKAFPRGLTSNLVRGSSGTEVVAVQYALGRLGFLRGLCDGSFGGMTELAVINFQNSKALTATGSLDTSTLMALDRAVAALDLRAPAVKSTDPLAYLSNFRALGLPVLSIHSTAEVFTWGSPEIRTAFGQFVAFYWEVMKRNRVEGDCKNIALFFMDQFRKQLSEDRMINLPHPVLRSAFAEKKWIIATSDKTQGLFSRADKLLSSEGLRVSRPGYGAIVKVQALDSQHSMLYGVNVHYPQISADQVAKSCTRLFDWRSSYDNRGDSSKPELPVDQLAAGNIIFIDHSGDGKFDHTVTVVKVEKDTAGHTRKIVMAVGSYDDVRDTSSATSVEGVGLSIVNTYSEEVTVELNEAGQITSSEVTYSSEPSYLVDTRYSARTTLMEQKAGGKLIVARWG